VHNWRDPRLVQFSQKNLARVGRKYKIIARHAGTPIDTLIGQGWTRKTGQLPTDLVKHVAKTELQKLREHMQAAAKQLDQFSISMDRITRIMHDEEITNAKGQASTALVVAFERACTQMASVNPATSKRAFAILRGAA